MNLLEMRRIVVERITDLTITEFDLKDKLNNTNDQARKRRLTSELKSIMKNIEVNNQILEQLNQDLKRWH